MKRTVTGAPATPAEAAQQAAKDALDASQKYADDAINSAHKVAHFLPYASTRCIYQATNVALLESVNSTVALRKSHCSTDLL